MTIYMITNLLNNKKYIGITCRKNIKQRWVEHKSKARKNKQYVSLINRAIKKYGEENFKFEIIKKMNDCSIETLLKEEARLIHKNKTLAPLGYNIKDLQTYSCHSTETLKKISSSNQGIKKGNTSKYIGVYLSRDSYRFEIKKNNTSYNKSSSSEIQAAKDYDKMALKLYGSKAITNFPNKEYSKLEIEDFFNNFYKQDRSNMTSKYKYIYFDKRRKKYIVEYKGTYLGQYSCEEEAHKNLQKHIQELNE